MLQFFDARSEYSFEAIVKGLRDIGAQIGPTAVVPEEGFVADGIWNNHRITIGYRNEDGSHIVAPSRAVAEQILERLDYLAAGA
ncbi:MAG TPA: hypothetical protein DHW63_08380 [Hyphomonadaceae bacterium]|nr:hypothetical protein [Hyphomonadaceae bacterium]